MTELKELCKGLDSKKKGRPVTYKPEYGHKILESMKNGYTLLAAAKECGVTRHQIRHWCENFPEFEELVEIGNVHRLHFLETQFLNALQGKIRTQAALAIFGLKNSSLGRELWRDRVEVETKSFVENNLDLSKMSTDELAFLAKMVEEQKITNGPNQSKLIEPSNDGSDSS